MFKNVKVKKEGKDGLEYKNKAFVYDSENEIYVEDGVKKEKVYIILLQCK